MTGVWLNSCIMLMWKVLFWHCQNKANLFQPIYYDTNNPMPG